MLTIEIEAGNATEVTLFVPKDSISHIARVRGNMILETNYELILKNGMVYKINEKTFNKIDLALSK